MARPKISPEKRRTVKWEVPLSKIETQRLQALAELRGVSVAQILRGAAMAEVRNAEAERPRKSKAA